MNKYTDEQYTSYEDFKNSDSLVSVYKGVFTEFFMLTIFALLLKNLAPTL